MSWPEKVSTLDSGVSAEDAFISILLSYWVLFFFPSFFFIVEITVDQLVDVVVGNRQYKPCLYLYNKIDTVTIEEVRHINHRKNCLPPQNHRIR